MSLHTEISTSSGRILLIDDDVTVLNVTKLILERIGYRVTATSSSVDAIDIFRTDPDLFDLVLTDMAMPGMTGDVLARRIMEIRRDMPVIICTGYSEHMTKELAREMGIRDFIAKPSKMNELSEIVRKVLDERTGCRDEQKNSQAAAAGV